MEHERITTIANGQRVWTMALPGLDQEARPLLLGLSAIYDTEDRLLYREMHDKRDLEDVWRQHDGIVAGVQDGRIRLSTPAQRGRERESERCTR